MSETEPRVLLDATAIPADRGGVGRYVEGIVAAYRGDLVVVCQRRDLEALRRLAPHAELVAAPAIASRTWARLLWEQLGLPRLARKQHAEVIHSPHYTLPVASGLPRVVTFHDATFFSDPAVHRTLKRGFFRTWIRVSARLAAGIVVPSASTGAEIARFVALRGPVTVAHHGVDLSVFHPPAPDAVDGFAKRHGLAGDWIAFLGTLEPRKNLPALIRALGALARTGREVPPLVLAGARGWDTALDDVIREEPEVDVRRAGYLGIDELPALLGGATLVAYPSLGEGFGLPVLEAMACRAAVLTTRRLALPEVGGEAVAYTEPDPSSIAEAVGELLAAPARRDQLRAAAVERAGRFSWDASARAHHDAFRNAAGSVRGTTA
ncbi:MAG: glycosyltransferase family 1 protein [Protaetiibacter sp.]